MLLSHEYRLVRASRDFSGWITPDGKFLRHVGSHADTLRSHNIALTPDEAVLDGYVWMNQEGVTLYCELHYSRFHSLQRQLEKVLGGINIPVNFELFNDSGKRTKDFEMGYFDGSFEE